MLWLWWSVAAAVVVSLVLHANNVEAKTVEWVNPKSHVPDDLPLLLSEQDIAQYYLQEQQQGSLEVLHAVLQAVWEKSYRNPELTEDESTGVTPALSSELMRRGSGWNFTAAYKLQHDIDQCQYIWDVLHERDRGSALYFKHYMSDRFKKFLNKIQNSDHPHDLYNFEMDELPQKHSDRIYNIAMRRIDVQPSKTWKPGQDGGLQWANTLNENAIQQPPLIPTNKEHKKQGLYVVDNALTDATLRDLQRILWESVIWFEVHHPIQQGGYLGAYLDDGLHDLLVLHMARDIAQTYGIKAPLLKIVAHKFDAEYQHFTRHQDDDHYTTKVTLFLSPEGANLNPETGGLKFFVEKENEEETITVPYQTNRAIVYDPTLPHADDKFHFKEGYQNRRITLSLYYGQPLKGEKGTTETTMEAGDKRDEL